MNADAATQSLPPFPRRQLLYDFHTPGFLDPILDRYDADAFAAQVAASGAESVVIFTKCIHGYTYYPSDVGTPHPGLHFDYFGTTLAALKKLGLGVFGYYCLRVNDVAGRAHPEWRPLDANGKPFRYQNTWENVCYNTESREALFLPQMHELFSRYTFNGIWMDGAALFPNCMCAGCRERFERETGQPLTPQTIEQAPELYDAFFDRCAAESRRDVFNIAEDHGQHVWCGPLDINAAHLVEDLDGIFTEREIWPRFRHRDYLAPLVRGMPHRRDRRPYQAITTLARNGWGEHSIKPLAQLRYELAMSASIGAVTVLGQNLHPSGETYDVQWARYRDAFAWLAPFFAHSDDQQIKAPLAMLLTARDATEAPAAGCVRLALQMHLPCDLVPVEQADLGAYRSWVVSDARQVPGAWADALPEWLEGGGRLLIVGQPPRTGDGQCLLTRLGLVAEAPVHEPVSDSYFRCEALSQAFGDMPLLIPDGFWRCTPAGGSSVAEIVLPLVSRDPESMRLVSQRSSPAGEPAGCPAVQRWSIGEGSVTYVTFSLFRIYDEEPYDHLWECGRMLLDELVEGRRLFRISSDVSLHAILAGSADRARLHLIVPPALPSTHPAALQPPATRFPALRDVDVEWLREPQSVVMQPSGESIGVDDSEPGVWRVTVPEIDQYIVLDATFTQK